MAHQNPALFTLAPMSICPPTGTVRIEFRHCHPACKAADLCIFPCAAVATAQAPASAPVPVGSFFDLPLSPGQFCAVSV